MIVSAFACFLCVTVGTINNTKASSIPLVWSDVTVERRQASADGIGKERRKRGVIIGRAAIKGLWALRNLLKDTNPLPYAEQLFGKTKHTQYHEKRGDYSQALEDFFSVNPAKVSHYELPGKNFRTVGRVGDRIILMEKNLLGGMPSIEIVKGIDKCTKQCNKTAPQTYNRSCIATRSHC